MVIGAAGTTLAAVALGGWFRAATRPVEVTDLSAADRQALVQGILDQAPGVLRPTYFHPPIGYTLRPRQELEAWNDRFVANEIGYRTRPVDKPVGTFRVLFVGDSWTYGYGLPAEQSFPRVFERLANRHSGDGRTVEAWTLALPGYNTLNQVSALWFFLGDLQPDAVIICPTTNDHDSTATILPNGSSWRGSERPDLLGDPHTVTYPGRYQDSTRARQRWSTAMALLRDTEKRLQTRSLPLMFFFVAIWSDDVVHGLVQESGLESPYVAIPGSYCVGKWALPPPTGHGTAEANVLYARTAYAAFSRLMGWGALPDGGSAPVAELHRSPPGGVDWIRRRDQRLRRTTREAIPESFTPSRDAREQCAGPMDSATGEMGSATTILVRRRAGATKLAITVAELAFARDLSPLKLSVTVPSRTATAHGEFEVFTAGRTVERVEVPIPGGISPGSAIDVILEVDRVTRAADRLVARSLSIRSIEQHE